jgi:hypothetical protein
VLVYPVCPRPRGPFKPGFGLNGTDGRTDAHRRS